MQVVTSENFQRLVETGKVEDFKPPEPAKTEAEVAKAETADPPRGEDGKFVAKDAEATTDTAAKAEDEEDRDLTEHVRRKIGAKHRQMKEAEEFAEQQYNERKAAEKRAEKFEQELHELRTKSRPAPVEDNGPPNPDDFKTVAEYTDALTDYKLEKKLAEYRQNEAARTQQEAAAKMFNAHQERLAKAMKEIPDFEEITSIDVNLPPHISQHIVESEVGPLLGYHLAKYPEERDRIFKLSPVRAVAELGKLEMKLEKPAKVEADKPDSRVTNISKAPTPITPLDGKSTPVQKDPAKMSFQELRAWDKERRAAGRR